MSNSTGAPQDSVVTVVVAAFNVEAYVDEALLSIRGQSLDAIEILVVDDRSTDGTRERLVRQSLLDPRIRIIDGPGNGPAAARNMAIGQAQGRWIAIVDADDVIEPDRLARLTAEGDRHAVDAVADNMIAFYEEDPTRDHPWIDAAVWPTPRALTFQDLMNGGLGAPPAPELGYLKPVLRRARLAQLGDVYRENLVIGEDFDLMARWTAAGFTYRYEPQAGYRYRRRVSSLSYRLSPDQIDDMIAALDRLDRTATQFDAASVAYRTAALREVQLYARRVERLKRRDLTALAALLADADGRRRLKTSIREGLGRRLRSLRRPVPA
ncbi:MAG: glycosyltransferase family 2 protein [Brevundimonas sp.]